MIPRALSARTRAASTTRAMGDESVLPLRTSWNEREALGPMRRADRQATNQETLTMDTQRPHYIIPDAEIPKDDKRARERFMPLTDEETMLLAPMTPDERHAWIKAKLPTKERLARHLASEGLNDLAYNARLGRYDDFDEGGVELPQIELLRDLKRKGRHDLTWIVTSDEYGATKAESDCWAARQTGEIRELIDKMSASKEPLP